MRILITLMLVVASINLSACSSVRGNVVPQTGPTMEQIYDGMGAQHTSENTSQSDSQDDLKKWREEATMSAPVQSHTRMTVDQLPTQTVSEEFRKLPNPEMKLYIYPHLAGEDQVPVPGYFTVFNVYDHDHYALAQE